MHIITWLMPGLNIFISYARNSPTISYNNVILPCEFNMFSAEKNNKGKLILILGLSFGLTNIISF